MGQIGGWVDPPCFGGTPNCKGKAMKSLGPASLCANGGARSSVALMRAYGVCGREMRISDLSLCYVPQDLVGKTVLMMVFSREIQKSQRVVSERKMKSWWSVQVAPRHGTFAGQSGYPSDTSVHQLVGAHSLVLPSHFFLVLIR